MYTAVFVASIVLIICILGVWLISRPSEKANLHLQATMKIISEQAPAIARRRVQLIYTDHYGVEKLDKWEKEKLYIASSVINPKLQAEGFGSLPNQFLLPLIEHAVCSVEITKEVADFTKVSTGIQYEQYCAQTLQEVGWNAQLTKATGDQGTDIIAERDGRRIVVQCKFYSSPVGNKAVQEAAAARLHERADQAIVVSNATYTNAARQLAGTTGVILLHHDDLASFGRV
jgi:restriction system protein